MVLYKMEGRRRKKKKKKEEEEENRLNASTARNYSADEVQI